MYDSKRERQETGSQKTGQTKMTFSESSGMLRAQFPYGNSASWAGYLEEKEMGFLWTPGGHRWLPVFRNAFILSFKITIRMWQCLTGRWQREGWGWVATGWSACSKLLLLEKSTAPLAEEGSAGEGTGDKMFPFVIKSLDLNMMPKPWINIVPWWEGLRGLSEDRTGSTVSQFIPMTPSPTPATATYFQQLANLVWVSVTFTY